MKEKANNGKKKELNPGKNEKQKKKVDTWGYYLAWLGFGAAILGAIHTLLKKSDTPKKNDFYV